MGATKYCLFCSESIDIFAKKCKYCGENQYGDNNEYAPTPQSDAIARRILYGSTNMRRRKTRSYTNKERLVLGLYPKDEGYKMSLISRILGKR